MAPDYPRVVLGDVAQLGGGYSFKSKDWTTTGVPVLKIANVLDGRITTTGCSFVNPSVATAARQWALAPGDILVGMTGYVGAVGRVRPDQLPALLNQRVGKFSVTDPGRLDEDFLFFSLRNPAVRREWESVATGSAQANISGKQLCSVAIPLPPLPEQRRIAAVLGALDDKIELNRKMTRTLEEIAQAIFKSWFIDFYGVPPGDLVDKGLGPAPSNWQLGAIAEFSRLATESVRPGDAPDIQWEHYSIPAFDEGQRPSLDLGHSIKSGKYRVPPDAVLVSKLNPRFPRVWMPDVRDHAYAVCSTEFMPFTPHENRRAFVYDFFCSPPTQSAICAKVTGSTGSRQRVKPKEIADMPTMIPPSSMLDRYEETVSPLHQKRLMNRAEIATLGELRDTLLPKLISGELRVPEAEGALEATA